MFEGRFHWRGKGVRCILGRRVTGRAEGGK
jgi:hypothetical protein